MEGRAERGGGTEHDGEEGDERDQAGGDAVEDGRHDSLWHTGRG
jgi:hypothetical protein